MGDRGRYCGVREHNRERVRPGCPDNPANPPGSDRATAPIAISPADPPRPPARSNAGWRGVVSRMPGINLGPGKAQSDERRWRDLVGAPVETVFPVAVFNMKGGVGTTTVVEALGSTFAAVRRDRVIAVDLQAGDLADRHGGPGHQNAAGLEILGLGGVTRRIERTDYAKAFEKLRHHYPVVLTDCGNTLKSGVVSAALRRSRAIVVVSSASVEAIRRTRTTLEWLRNNGYQHLLESTVLAINHLEAGKPDAAVDTDLAKMARHFPAAPIIALPFDRHLAAGGAITLEQLSRASRRRYLQLAAALAELFPSSELVGAAPR